MDNEEESEISDEEKISVLNVTQLISEGTIKKTKFKTGVVYMSYIPPYMSTDILRRMLSKYAPVGRIFIQVIQEPGETKKRIKEDIMREGWVEFLKKRHAKGIAATLNNTKMGGKKKSRFFDCLWNIKYLPRFKWVHLMERLNYERAVMQQKLRAEISQAKRVANHFKDAVEKQEFDIKRRKKGESLEINPADESSILTDKFKQKVSKEERNKQMAQEKRENFLKSLFS